MAVEGPHVRIEAAMAALATQDIDGVLADARAEARARVTRILADELTRALLQQARGAGAPAPRADPPPREPASVPPRRAPDVLYVLCVTAASAQIPAGTPGIADDQPPHTVVHGELAAVICPVPQADFGEDQLREHLQDMAWLERIARTHEGILEQIAEETTLVPMRLCTLIETESGVRELLIREQQSLAEALTALKGKSEWGVKAFAGATPPAEPEPAAGEAPTGTDYMRQRQAAHQRKQRHHEQLTEACTQIHATLAELAANERSNPPQRSEVSGGPGEMLLNGAYLVDDEQLTPFLARLQELAEEYEPQGLMLESSGPWPAYNFVPDTLGVAW